MDCTIRIAKTKALISFAVTAKLICVFVFAYANSRFSHDAAQINLNFELGCGNRYNYLKCRVLNLPLFRIERSCDSTEAPNIPISTTEPTSSLYQSQITEK